MATFVSQYSTTGFYKAPVSKGLMGALFVTCTAINVPLLSHLRQYLVCQLPQAITSGQVWRLFTSRCAFLETRDLIFGVLLIYYFRVFERRLGSRRFASHLLAAGLLSLALETAAVVALRAAGLEAYHDGHLPPGPYGVIFSLFVPYLCDIPRVTRTRLLGVPVTGKTLTYLVGLQVCSSGSWPTWLSAACGVAAGAWLRRDLLAVRRWLRVPRWLAAACDATLGRLLASAPPVEGPMGATLELQRQEQMERLEQQMMLQRTRDARRLANGNAGVAAPPRHNQHQGYAERLVGPPQMFQPNPFEQMHRGEPSEENVTFLAGMGFGRERALRALRATGDDVEAAANLLLQEA